MSTDTLTMADAGRALEKKGPPMSTDTLTVIDNRTGKSYEITITDGAIKASDLRKLKTNPGDYGLMSYDPAFTNTASTKSAITYLDGDNGKLYYRGYPIEQLAEKSTHLETAYLILNGELPTVPQLEAWETAIKKHWFIHENIKHLIDCSSAQSALRRASTPSRPRSSIRRSGTSRSSG